MGLSSIPARQQILNASNSMQGLLNAHTQFAGSDGVLDRQEFNRLARDVYFERQSWLQNRAAHQNNPEARDFFRQVDAQTASETARIKQQLKSESLSMARQSGYSLFAGAASRRANQAIDNGGGPPPRNSKQAGYSARVQARANQLKAEAQTNGNNKLWGEVNRQLQSKLAEQGLLSSDVAKATPDALARIQPDGSKPQGGSLSDLRNLQSTADQVKANPDVKAVQDWAKTNGYADAKGGEAKISDVAALKPQLDNLATLAGAKEALSDPISSLGGLFGLSKPSAGSAPPSTSVASDKPSAGSSTNPSAQTSPSVSDQPGSGGSKSATEKPASSTDHNQYLTPSDASAYKSSFKGADGKTYWQGDGPAGGKTIYGFDNNNQLSNAWVQDKDGKTLSSATYGRDGSVNMFNGDGQLTRSTRYGDLHRENQANHKPADSGTGSNTSNNNADNTQPGASDASKPASSGSPETASSGSTSDSSDTNKPASTGATGDNPTDNENSTDSAKPTSTANAGEELTSDKPENTADPSASHTENTDDATSNTEVDSSETTDNDSTADGSDAIEESSPEGAPEEDPPAEEPPAEDPPDSPPPSDPPAA